MTETRSQPAGPEGTPPPDGTAAPPAVHEDEARPTDYTRTARGLHWLVAVMVPALVAIGYAMTGLPLQPADKLWYYQLHKSLGLTVLALMLVRIAWRLAFRPPPLPDEMGRWHRGAAHLAHLLLYALVLAMPITGWLMVSASSVPVPTRWFDLLDVPHWPPLAMAEPAARQAYAAFFKELHAATGAALAALIGLHVLAALWHGLVRRDGVLSRMLKGQKPYVPPLPALAIVAAAAALLQAPFAMSAHASEPPRWTVDPAHSSITFEVAAGKDIVRGRFARFEARIHLDPADPSRTGIAALIETGSVATGVKDIDAALAGRDWLDASGHPRATYHADRGERLADGRYRVLGWLTIKDRTLALALDYTLRIDGRRATATGELSVARSAFAIGPAGPIAGLVIGDAVRVRIEIVAGREG